MSASAKFLLAATVLSTLLSAPAAYAGDKAQAWGARMPNSRNTTMRNRAKSARVWIGEQARGWGVGSRMTSNLTTSMHFHAKGAAQAVDAIKTNRTQVVRESVSACGTCITLENSGDQFAITNSVLRSINGASVTTYAEFFN